jgi:Domain of unknown function (DUF4268)
MQKFGRLEKVDLHEVWYGGTKDFTPWLSEQENLNEFGNALGMELEIQEQRQNISVAPADILCKDALTNQPVIIICQLDRTDHTHLGQLITYAAGLEAKSIIWVARTFAEEHWSSLTWLNQVAGGSVNFFGVEIEAFKIGDSLPAPNFRILVKPNGWIKKPKRSVPGEKLTGIELLQLEYWHGLKNFMEANNSFVKLLGTPPKSSFNVPHEKGKYYLTVSVDSRDSSLNIWLNLIGEKARNDFDRLYEIAYSDSLVEVSQNLNWYKIHEKLGCAITLKAYADFTVKNDWPNQFAWFKENLEKFDKFFRDRIEKL